MKEICSYQDLQRIFGPYFPMPSEAYMKGDAYEYRCPYHSMCPAKADCFSAGTPEPLQDSDILNVSCRLCGNQKIPVYARMATRIMK